MPVKGKHLLHLVPHGINSDEFKALDSKHQSIVKLKKEYFKVDIYIYRDLWLIRNMVYPEFYLIRTKFFH